MKLKTNTKSTGNVLMVTLLTIFIIGLGLVSYLTMISIQNQATFRSLAWNTGIPVTEAGVEEALTQLHYAGKDNLSANGWVLSGGLYSRQRTLPDGSQYSVSIKPGVPPAQPVITCTASVVQPASFRTYEAYPPYYGMLLGAAVTGGSGPTFVSRTVQVTVTNAPLFSKAMVSLGQINMNGNNVTADSFDSTDPNYSDANGQYVAGKSKDHGDVATVSGLVNSFNVGNADIKGNASTGPGGNINVGSQGSVGDAAWVNGKNKGVQAGHFSDDMNVQFPDVDVPFTSGYTTPIGGTVNGTSYNYLLAGDASLGTGRYQLSALSGSVYVAPGANVVLYVPGNADLTGIVLGTNASIKIYNGTKTGSSQSVSIGGNGAANNGGKAWNFQYYGLPSVTSISFGGNAAYTGVIYAPEASLDLHGGGNNRYDFVGSSVTKSITMNGHFNFHYDEGLMKYGPNRNYVITSWNEL